MHQRSQCATNVREPSKEEVVSSTASIVRSDATEFLLSLSERPRLVLTDPPYGIGYKSNMPGDHHWNSTGVPLATRRGLPLPSEIMAGDSSPDDIEFTSFFKAAYTALKDNGVLAVFGSWEAISRWQPMIKMAGFKIRDPVIWNKLCGNGGDLRWPFGRTVEYILPCTKGRPKTYPVFNAQGILKKRTPCVLSYGRVPTSEYVGHPTQKPLFLCSQVVRAFSDDGEFVVDPFCGSGSTLVAASLLGRRVAGCDVEAKYVSMTRKRLADQSIVVSPPKSMRSTDRKQDAKAAWDHGMRRTKENLQALEDF